MPLDPVDLLIAQLRSERSAREPLHVTGRLIWDRNRGRLDPDTLVALRKTGEAAVNAEGEPVEYPSHDADNLAFLGFMAIAAEQLIAEE